MTIGQRIKKLRDDANMQQTELAERINVKKQTLYKYENDIVTNIPSDKIETIARTFNVTPAYLMGWEDENVDVMKEFEDFIEKNHILQSKIMTYLNMFSKLSPESQDNVIDYIDYQITKEKKDNG